MKPGPRPGPFLERFWVKVKKSDGCWEWTASCVSKGYGQFVVSHGTLQGRWLAHRLSWVIHFGTIPKGEGYHGTCVLHRCDNPKCVRPDHLWLGSNADNIRDCVAKGRASKVRAQGEHHPMAKLTKVQVLRIRQDHRTQAAIAREYGVTATTIANIQHHKKWRAAA